jgi:hypothetical protein
MLPLIGRVSGRYGLWSLLISDIWDGYTNARSVSQLSDNLDYWRNNSYPIAFQNHHAGFIITGERIHINGYGKGGINGNGNAVSETSAPCIRHIRGLYPPVTSAPETCHFSCSESRLILNIPSKRFLTTYSGMMRRREIPSQGDPCRLSSGT